MCGGEYNVQAKGFTRSFASKLWNANNDYIPVCRSCVERMYEDYYIRFRNEKAAIKRICIKFDYYFSPLLVEKAKANQERTKVNQNTSLIFHYLDIISAPEYSAKAYDSTLIEEEGAATISIQSLGDIDAVAVSKEGSANETEEQRKERIIKDGFKIWGGGFTGDEYLELTEEYDDWNARYIIDGKAREMLVKELCVNKLFMNRALREGNTDQYNKCFDIWRKTLDAAELSPKVERAKDKENEIPLGKMIERFEKERPVPKPLPEWEDVDGIIKFVTVYFLGHLCKMLGIKNKFAKYYEEEMDRWRVKLPELESCDDDEVLDHILGSSDPDSMKDGGSPNGDQE